MLIYTVKFPGSFSVVDASQLELLPKSSVPYYRVALQPRRQLLCASAGIGGDAALLFRVVSVREQIECYSSVVQGNKIPINIRY